MPANANPTPNQSCALKNIPKNMAWRSNGSTATLHIKTDSTQIVAAYYNPIR